MSKQCLAKRLRSLRDARGMTRRELAERIGITEIAIYNYETGRRTPEPKILEKLAMSFGTTLSALRDDAGTAEAVRDELLETKQKLDVLRQRVASTPRPKLNDINALAETTERIAFLEKTLAEITTKATPVKVVPVLDTIPTELPLYIGAPEVSGWMPVKAETAIDYVLVVPNDNLDHVGGDLALVHATDTARNGDLVVAAAEGAITFKYYSQSRELPIAGVVRSVIKKVAPMPQEVAADEQTKKK